MISILKNMTGTKELSNILDRKSVMEEFNISESTYHRWSREENLPVMKVRNRVFHRREEIDKWLNSYK